MIIAIGMDTDRTFTYFLEEAIRRSIDVQPVNLRAVVDTGSWRLAAPDDGESWIEAAGERIRLDRGFSYYCRLVDLAPVQESDERARAWRGLTYGLAVWLANVAGPVVNPPWAWSDNFTKPMHETTLLDLGFKVPESLTTSDAIELRSFARRSRSIIKTISSVRADARLISEADLAEFDEEAGPIHIQKFIEGFDVRAHVLGDKVFSERVLTDEVDYRCADEKTYEPWTLPSDLERLICEATRDHGLLFAGWDFKVDAEHEYWCLEANPMPGYHTYDRRLDRVITTALFAELMR